MTIHNSSRPPPLDRLTREIHRDLYAAFEREPDSANILQGVRTFRKGRPHVRVVLFPSFKNGGVFIACEGRLEAQMAISLEIDPDVARYRSQPIEIPSPAGRVYVPDFLAERRDGTLSIIDVKPQGRLLDPRVTERMRYLRHLLGCARLDHRLVTEVELEAHPAQQIRKSLCAGVSAVLSAADRALLLEQIRHCASTTNGSLRGYALSKGMAPYCIEKLALNGDITFPLNTQWSVHGRLEISHANHSEPAASRGTVHAVRIPV